MGDSRSASAGGSPALRRVRHSRASRPRRSKTSSDSCAGLFRGEVVIGHDGPAGKLPGLAPRRVVRRRHPARVRRVRAELARARGPLLRHGRAPHVLHRRDGRAVRRARYARRPKRPAAIPRRCGSGRATRRVHDGLPEELRLKKTVGRLATYLQGYGDLLVETNSWDPEVFDALSRRQRRRRRSLARSTPRPTPPRSNTSRRCCPTSGSNRPRPATPERCAERVLRQFDLGVDGVIMHGATPTELEPVVESYRTLRPADRFDKLDPNPGR